MNQQYLRLFLLLLTIFVNTTSFPQEQEIKIIVKTNSLSDDSQIHISGNNDQLGNWNYMQPMIKRNETEWQFELSSNRGDTLQFKFNRGSWRTEAVDSNGIEYPNFVYVVAKDTTLTYIIPGWRDIVQKKIIVSKERMQNKAGTIDLLEGWKYKIGDDTTWAATDFDDSKWKTINPMLPAEEFNKLDWKGNIWFRNHIIVDSSLWNKPLGLIFSCTGAADVYLNGKLLYKYGSVGNSKETEVTYLDRNPKQILFDAQEVQVIAVRYSNYSAEEITDYNVIAGFYAVIGELNAFIADRINSVRERSIIQMVFSAFVLAFSIMHLLLFIFYPKAKENLFYSISMLSFSVVIYTGIQGDFVNSVKTAIEITIVNVVSIETAILFGLLTVYASTYVKMPRQYIYFTIFWVVFILQAIFFPRFESQIAEYAFYAYAIILSLEIFRVVIRSLIKKDSWGWGWIIGIGFLVAFIFIAYQILIILNIVRPLFGIYIVFVYGIVFLAITVSVNLSKKVADTNKDLEKQLIQVKELSQRTIEQERKVKEEELSRKLLEADNQRKTKELEEARKLQLSMLPKSIPKVPGLEIAVYMKTASEVGGDYYDFKYDNNDTLIVAVGDATGHGMKAGTMVATIKGLFTAEDADTDVVTFMNKSNSIIRDMRLGNIYMAMLVAKIEREKVTITSAGMPPALIYRSKSKQVEEIKLQAIPLGGPADFTYPKKETFLSKGETLLLMSDGFPELFNNKKEILDYSRAKEIFGSIETATAAETIDFLLKEVENWRGSAKQEDDITFVVIKKM